MIVEIHPDDSTSMFFQNVTLGELFYVPDQPGEPYLCARGTKTASRVGVRLSDGKLFYLERNAPVLDTGDSFTIRNPDRSHE